METEDIINKIKDWCFSQESKIINDHNLFQSYLVDFLKQNEWYAYKEYQINNYPKPKDSTQPTGQPSTESTGSTSQTEQANESTSQIQDRIEFLDICAFAHNKKLAIEYDNNTHIKTPSINKLFYSNADYPIAIVRGKFGKAFLRFENTSKIKRTAKNMSITNKKIFLIVIENKIAAWIQV